LQFVGGFPVEVTDAHLPVASVPAVDLHFGVGSFLETLLDGAFGESLLFREFGLFVGPNPYLFSHSWWMFGSFENFSRMDSTASLNSSGMRLASMLPERD
jgi:hypothetical protein